MKRFGVPATVLGALLMVLTAAGARAESGAGPEAMVMGNMCMVMFGYDMINITATKPEISRADYCEEIPAIRKTVFVFDIANPKYRDYPLEVRVIKDPLRPVSADEELAALTVIHRPAQAYPKGTFAFEHTFKEGGHYIGYVTITRESGEKETQQWKFQVGETLWSWVPQIAGTVLIAGALFVYWKHTHPASRKKTPETPAAS